VGKPGEEIIAQMLTKKRTSWKGRKKRRSEEKGEGTRRVLPSDIVEKTSQQISEPRRICEMVEEEEGKHRFRRGECEKKGKLSGLSLDALFRT